MADRSVLVRLRADITQYQAGMSKAKQSTQEFGREITGVGKTASADVERVGHAALLVGGVMAVGFGRAIQVGMGFEKQMSGVQAVSGATAEEMNKLSEAALAAGASQTLAGVTATDAAAAEAELVKAGVAVNDILGGALVGSLSLAAAGQIEFADAATIAAQAMNIFDLNGRDVNHIADVLAAAANKSATDVGALGDALRQGGLVAAQTGLTLEETVGTLAAFGDNALIGSDAGTSLKTMLQRLTPVSKESAELMEDLGFSAYDAQGNFIGLEGLAGELQTAMQGMTVEQRNLTLATLFGSDAVRGANVLYEEGAEGMGEYVDAVNDQGAAARMAAIQNDNLAGDIDALGGAFETALIENGSKANEVLRFLTQTTTGLVTGFTGLPDMMQSGAVGLAGFAAAGTLAIGAIGTVAPKMVEAKKALENMGTSGAFVAGHMRSIVGSFAGIGAGVAVFAAWEGMLASARAEAEKLSAGWEDIAFNEENTASMAAFRTEFGLVVDEQVRMSDEANSGSAPWDADHRATLRAGAAELEGIGTSMGTVINAAEDLADQYGLTEDAALEFVLAQQAGGADFNVPYENLVDVLGETYLATVTGTTGAHEMEGAMGTLGSEVASVEDELKAFNDALGLIYDNYFAVRDAQDELQRGLNDLPGVLKAAAEEGLNLNDILTGQTNAAIDVRDHMEGMTQAALDVISKWKEQGVEGEELNIAIGMLSQSFRDQATAAGVPEEAVDHYLGVLDEIPREKVTTVTANTDVAALKLRTINILLGNIPSVVGVRVDASYAGPSYRRASGGPVSASMGDVLVGEEGPEIVRFSGSGHVYSAADTQRMMGGMFSGAQSSLSMPTGGGTSSTNNSRTFRIDAPITVASISPHSGAVETAYELRKLAVAMTAA